MSVTALLDDLHKRGVRLVPDGDGLRASAGAGIITEQDKAAISAHKPALVDLLRASDNNTNTTAPPTLAAEASRACAREQDSQATDGSGRAHVPALSDTAKRDIAGQNETSVAAQFPALSPQTSDTSCKGGRPHERAALICSTCSTPLTVEDFTNGWRHIFCAAAVAHFDEWRPLTADRPPLFAVWGEPDPRRRSWELVQAGQCPSCTGQLAVQQREPLTAWCAGCRTFFDERFFYGESKDTGNRATETANRLAVID